MKQNILKDSYESCSNNLKSLEYELNSIHKKQMKNVYKLKSDLQNLMRKRSFL